jgi:regulator of chromosome condensation
MSSQPLRRSARAASQKPEEPKAAAVKAAIAKAITTKGDKSTRPVGRTPSRSNKRAASPDSSSQPVKRARSRAASVTEDAKKLPPKKTPATTAAKKVTKQPTVNGLTPIQEQKAYFNSLPTPPEHPRPHANQLFCWGAGNFGQFGWGADNLGELSTPKRNTWFENRMPQGDFGGTGAGLEAIAAGGLHTLFIDEKGTVSSISVRADPISA